MICIVTKPVDLGRYIEVYNLLKAHPGESVCHIDWANLSGLRSDETLYISGHGDSSHVEGKNAVQFAALLVSRGLTSMVALKKIKLLSCEGGQTSLGNIPFCQQLADALAGNGGPRTLVVGLDGATAVTDQAGKTWAKDTPQSSYPNWNDFRKTYGSKYEAADKAANGLPCTNEKEIRDNANALAGLTSDIFNWLYQENAKYVKQRPGGKKDPLAKTYGIPDAWP